MESLRDRLIHQIQITPTHLLQELLDFLLFLKSKKTSAPQKNDNPYPLRGLPVEYIDPTEPVASLDWDVLS